MDRAFLCRPIGFTSISAGGGAGGPTTNVGNDQLGRVWLGGGSVTVGFPSQDIDTIAVLATNAGSAVSWTTSVGGASGQLWASPEAGDYVHRNGLVHFAPTTASSVTINLSGGGSDLAVGRILVGKSYKPGETTNESIDFGWEFDVVDHGESEVMATGVDNDLPLARVLRFRAAWGWETEEEARVQLLKLKAYAGITRPVLFCADYEAADLHNVIGYGAFTDSVRTKHIAVDGYTSSFELRSRLILSL